MNEQEYNEQEVYIRNGLRIAQATFHKSSSDAGWWNDPQDGYDLRGDVYAYATKIALIHSEASEALEGLRTGAMDDKLPHRTAVEVELADVLIRVFDLAGAMELDLAEAVIEKMRMNQIRPDHKMENRRKVGGKKF